MAAAAHNPGVSVSSGALPVWHDGRPRIGIHTSIAGDPCRALETAHRIGCTAVQIFSCSPRMWPRPHQLTLSAPVARRFRERRAALRLGPVAVHANYLVNLATPDPRQWENAIDGFRYELLRAAQLGADFVIVHPGSPLGAGVDWGISRVADAIARASALAGPDGSARVLVENTAGQGTGMGSRFEHLRRILDLCAARGVLPQPGVCLDTAHLIAAGHEIHTAEGLERTIEEIDGVIGLDNVRVIHTNDSKAPCGSRRDRHEHIGRGHIGKEAFARILNHPRLAGPHRAFILETPIYRPGDDRRNVRTVWSLLGVSSTPLGRNRNPLRRAPRDAARNRAARRSHRTSPRSAR